METTARASTRRLLQLAVALLGMTQVGARGASTVTYELLDARVTAANRLPSGPISYVVTPSQRVFRILGSQPIRDADGTRLGSLLAYVGDTRDPEIATARSIELMNAWGPEAIVQGETAVLIQARVDFDPRKKVQSSVVLHVAFQLTSGRWTRLPEPPPRPNRPKTMGTGPLEALDQPGFPFDRSGLDEAATVVDRWLSATDAGDGRRLGEEMSSGMTSEVESRKAEWERSVSGRARLRAIRPRRESYRLQTWEGEPSPDGTRLYFLYSLDVDGLGPAVEKVKVVKEGARWRVRGYGLLVSPGQTDRLERLMGQPG